MQNQMCRQLVAVHKCRYYNQYEQVVKRNGGEQPVMHELVDKVTKLMRAPDIEDVVSHGRSNKCV